MYQSDLLARIDEKRLPTAPMHHGCDGPGHADAEKHVHRVRARHVANGCVGILVLARRHFARERVWRAGKD